MPRCEDFPCCGHEAGCCPSFSESGEQLDMVCTCGARLPVTNRSSICDACLSDEDDEDYEDYEDDDMDGDNASALASAGHGTDEDYEHHQEDYGDWGYEGMNEE